MYTRVYIQYSRDLDKDFSLRNVNYLITISQLCIARSVTFVNVAVLCLYNFECIHVCIVLLVLLVLHYFYRFIFHLKSASTLSKKMFVLVHLFTL